MSANIGTLTIEMAANIVRLQKDMDQAQRTVGNAMSRISAAASGATRMLGMLGVGAGAAGLAMLIKQSIDAADRMNDLAQQTGVNIRLLGGYKLAAEQSGTSIESVARGIKGLSGYVTQHADRLKAAGIVSRDANGLMIELADVFAAMPDGIEKTALATQLFGKAGMDMIPMLNMGSKGLADAQAKAKGYADQLAELAPRADAFNDKLSQLSLVGQSFGMRVAGPIVDGLSKILGALEKEITASPGSIIHWMRTQGGGANIRTGQQILDAMNAGKGGTKAAVATSPEEALRRARALLDADAKSAAAAAKARMDMLGRINETHAALLKETDALTAQVEKQREHVAALGLTNDQTLALEASRLALEVATKRQEIADNQALGGHEDTNDQLRIQIDLLDELYDLKMQDAAGQMADRYNNDNIERTGKLLEDGVAEWKKWEDERIKAAEDLGRSLTDNIMRGGKNAGEYLVDYFRTLVLRPMIQGVMQPVANAITNTIFGSGNGGGIGGGASLLSAGSNLMGGGTGLYGSFATSALGQSLGLSSLITSAPVYEAGGALVSAGSSAMGLSSLGAALPWIGGGLAIASALGLFGGSKEDPHNNPDARYIVGRLGMGGLTSAGGNLAHITMGQTSGQGRWADYSALSEAEIAATNKAAAAVFEAGRSLAEILGVDAKVMEEVSVEGERFASLEDMVGQLGDAVVLKLIPGLEQWQQGTESLTQTAQRVVGDIQALDSVAKALGVTFRMTGDAGQRVAYVEKLAAAAGGSDALRGSLSGFYANYFSDAERQGNLVADLGDQFSKLGYALPATRDEYRALVETVLAGGDASAETAGKLLSLQGALKSMFDYAAAATQATLQNAGFVRSGLTVGFTTLAEGALGLPSLTAPVLGSYASGTDWVPQTGLYQLHQGEKVTPRSENTGSDNASMRAELAAVRRATEAMADVLDRVSRGGTSLATSTI